MSKPIIILVTQEWVGAQLTSSSGAASIKAMVDRYQARFGVKVPTIMTGTYTESTLLGEQLQGSLGEEVPLQSEALLGTELHQQLKLPDAWDCILANTPSMSQYDCRIVGLEHSHLLQIRFHLLITGKWTPTPEKGEGLLITQRGQEIQVITSN